MKKFFSMDEIERAYKYKVAATKRWLTMTMEAFNKGLNVKKKPTKKKEKDNKEVIRQECMTLLQESCRMQSAIDHNNIVIPCISCHRSNYRWMLNGWHRTPRGNRRVCIHSMNINPQCNECNRDMNEIESDPIYTRYNQNLIDMYGNRKYQTFVALCEDKRTYTVTKDHRKKECDRLKQENERLHEEIKQRKLFKYS